MAATGGKAHGGLVGRSSSVGDIPALASKAKPWSLSQAQDLHLLQLPSSQDSEHSPLVPFSAGCHSLSITHSKTFPSLICIQKIPSSPLDSQILAKMTKTSALNSSKGTDFGTLKIFATPVLH